MLHIVGIFFPAPPSRAEAVSSLTIALLKLVLNGRTSALCTFRLPFLEHKVSLSAHSLACSARSSAHMVDLDNDSELGVKEIVNNMQSTSGLKILMVCYCILVPSV